MAAPPDPRDAKYWNEKAAIEHGRELAEKEDTRTREEAESAYKYGAGVLEREEPIALRGNANRANTEGLLQSGILAGRQGRTQTEYAGKQHNLSEIRRRAVDAANRGDARALEDAKNKEASILGNATERSKRALEANPPSPPLYVPSETQYPGAFVRVGTRQENEEERRRKAAQKAVG